MNMHRCFVSCALVLVALSPITAHASLTLADCQSDCFPTNSAAQVNQTQNNSITQVTTTFSTELVARMLNGPVVSDQTLDVGFNDSLIQALIGTDEALLSTAGAVSFQGPSLTNTITSFNSSFSTQTTISSQQFTGSHLFFGPTTVEFGDFGTCQSFALDANGYPIVSGCNGTPQQSFIPSGTRIFDTLTLTVIQSVITTIEFDARHVTQIYNLIGVPVPEPGTVQLVVIALVGLGFLSCTRPIGAGKRS